MIFYSYVLLSIFVAGTGVILPPNVEVWKVPLKAGQAINGDFFPVTEPSGKDDFRSIADCTGIAGSGVDKDLDV